MAVNEQRCEHGYACARCVRQGKSWTAPKTEQGREEFRRHLAEDHQVQKRPSWRYRERG